MTPEEIINAALEVRHNYKPDWGSEITEALDAAGYVIRRKDPIANERAIHSCVDL